MNPERDQDIQGRAKAMIRNFILIAAAAATAFAQSYQIDSAHSGAVFTVKHMMVTNVTGRFSAVKGTVVFDEKAPQKSSIDATIDIDTVNTNDAKRDSHLKAPDFFDSAKFPSMRFQSTKFYKADGVMKVDGNLTLHGVTKPVTLTLSEVSPEVKHPAGTMVRGATATTKLNRKDFGLTWNRALEAGGMMVGEDVNVTLEIELTRKPA
jgi:polyisoprenoid-binding protein YceI